MSVLKTVSPTNFALRVGTPGPQSRSAWRSQIDENDEGSFVNRPRLCWGHQNQNQKPPYPFVVVRIHCAIPSFSAELLHSRVLVHANYMDSPVPRATVKFIYNTLHGQEDRGVCKALRGVLTFEKIGCVNPGGCVMRNIKSVFPVRQLVVAAVLSAAVWSGASQTAAADLTTAIVEVARNTIPAVVHIEVTERQEVTNPMLPFENDPFFRKFFGMPKMPKKFKQEITGLGSGMIIDTQGHVLTNYHVAGGATKIEVVLNSGQRYSAKLVGGDPKTDLAVVKIETKERLTPVKFGNSDEVQVGQWVVAIGAPRGLDQSVTQGIISAKHRTGITDPSSYQDFLQTDAAINPGNSGGPLLNLRGEVIGINSVIATSSGGFEGVGFSIPSNIVVHIGKILIAHGKVIRGWLGVTVGDISYERAKSLGMSAPRGAYIIDVMKGSPAAAGGLEKGDVITTFDGTEVTNSSILRNQVSITAVGQQVKIGIFRAHKAYTVTVRIGTLQEAARAFAQSAERILGASFRPVTEAEVERHGLNSKEGVAVVRVEPKGPLGQAGFEKDDIILEINGQSIGDLESFLELASALRPHQQITLVALDHKSGDTGQVRVTTR